MKNLILLLSFIALFIFAGQPQAAAQGEDSNVSDDETKDIIAAMDSLMNQWYVKNSTPLRTKKQINTYGFGPNDVPVYSDSVFNARINRMESPLPYEYNEKVRGFIDLYATRKRELSGRILGLMDYYFPIMEEILDRHDVPIELKYLSIVESALNPRAVSRVGATGLWQFMYPTGRLYGLEVNSYVDDRKDPYLATAAAAEYLKDLHGIFGDWFLAIAAYNCGPGNVNKAIRRSGGKRTFWEIYAYLPAETRGYVPAFIAASYVFSYPQEHNLYPYSITLPMAVDTIVIVKDLSFAPVAKVLDVPIETIRDLNPIFKKDYIPARTKPYVLRLPANKAHMYCEYRDSIYVCHNGVSTVTIQPEFTLATTTSANTPQPKVAATTPTTPTGPTGGEKLVYYTVKSGDNISYIADWFDVSIYSVKRWNGLSSNTIISGAKLKLYVPADKLTYYKNINNLSLAQKQKLSNNGYTEAKTTTPAPVKTPAASKPASVVYYTVQKGDTLWSIAQKYPGVTVDEIKKTNGLNGNALQPGQKLKIMKG